VLRTLLLLFILIGLAGCFDPDNETVKKGNKDLPAASGDDKALALAQRVVAASGGKENWDQIPYISFDYFGRRYWFWDKANGRYRVESPPRKIRAAGKLDGTETYLWQNGALTTNPDSIAKYKDFAYKAWINDTYWLIFPFKILDPGVHLKYMGACNADSVTQATCIELTFDKVGVTPQNKYVAYIDTLQDQIIRWDYFEKATDSLPALSNPWNDYREYGKIKISGGRGDDTLKQITVHSILPGEIFTDVSKSYRDILNK